jgi:hypothetical protein
VRNQDRLTGFEANDESLMPAAGEVIREYASYYAFAFNLNIARPVFERAPDWTIVAGRTTALPRGVNRAVTGCPDQGTYKNLGNVDSLHSQVYLPTSSEPAESCLSHRLAAPLSFDEATQRLLTRRREFRITHHASL